VVGVVRLALLNSSIRTITNSVGAFLSFSVGFLVATAWAADFEVPDGFVVQQVADDSLVHDAFCMSLDSRGRPLVSGPGYVRTLLDEDRDGRFEKGVDWAKLPQSGAQGLWSEDSTVYWVGDRGLWRSDDRNGDLRGDGQPTLVKKLPTGGEHDAHAIRRGPDGWWYLIAGNYADDIQSLQKTSDPFIVKPRAGTIWRISPDFTECNPWVHGLRNAYDFDFLSDGRIVTYDSDEEREVSLPWYRPTRVMVMSPGQDAGWVNSASFDQDDRTTMPQVISKLGRGSPTGVAVYRHRVFPAKYQEAAFVLDWTFGRVIAVYPQPVDASDQPTRFMAETFMQANGTQGFAPTDLCVEPTGNLLVCVGGRGTTGAVYRISYESRDADSTSSRPSFENIGQIKDDKLRLRALLDMPCPWESWSIAQWKPVVEKFSMKPSVNGLPNIKPSFSVR
jgi:glucose/arabinose dehydrogenase